MKVPKITSYRVDILHAGDEDSDEDSEETVDPEEDEAKDNAAVQRKRAGVPELELDQLPSSVALKMMNLIYNNYIYCTMLNWL